LFQYLQENVAIKGKLLEIKAVVQLHLGALSEILAIAFKKRDL
jgi:hypothetical protein